MCGGAPQKEADQQNQKHKSKKNQKSDAAQMMKEKKMIAQWMDFRAALGVLNFDVVPRELNDADFAIEAKKEYARWQGTGHKFKENMTVIMNEAYQNGLTDCDKNEVSGQKMLHNMRYAYQVKNKTAPVSVRGALRGTMNEVTISGAHLPNMDGKSSVCQSQCAAVRQIFTPGDQVGPRLKKGKDLQTPVDVTDLHESLLLKCADYTRPDEDNDKNKEGLKCPLTREHDAKEKDRDIPKSTPNSILLGDMNKFGESLSNIQIDIDVQAGEQKDQQKTIELPVKATTGSVMDAIVFPKKNAAGQDEILVRECDWFNKTCDGKNKKMSADHTARLFIVWKIKKNVYPEH
eukprot:g20033.t1